MGAFSGGNGGSLPGSTSDIAVPDLVSQAKQAAKGNIDSGWLVSLWAALFAGLLRGLQVVIEGLVTLMDVLLIPVIKIITAFQGGHSPAAAGFVAAVIEDLLGVEVPSGMIQSGFSKGFKQGAIATGDAFLKVLLSEMAPSHTPLQPGDGMNAANAFLGFGIQFAVRQGNLEFLTQFAPEEIRFAEGIRAYGELMAKNLGLGRLTRLVFAPIMKILVQDPLTWWFNQQYQPTLLGASNAIKAYNRALIDQTTLFKEMSYGGYSPGYQAALTNLELTHPTTTELFTLFNHGRLVLGDWIAGLQRLNYSQDDATTLTTVSLLQQADGFLDQMAQTAYDKVLAGNMTQDAFTTYCNSIFTGGNKTQFWTARLSDELATPRKSLTWAQVSTAYLDGIIALDGLEAAAADQGYSAEDQLTLLLLVTAKLDTQEAKQATAQYKYNLAKAKAQKAGLPPPPPPAGLLP